MSTLTEVLASVVLQSSAAVFSHFGVCPDTAPGHPPIPSQAAASASASQLSAAPPFAGAAPTEARVVARTPRRPLHGDVPGKAAAARPDTLRAVPLQG